jgi:hypothetical protein
VPRRYPIAKMVAAAMVGRRIRRQRRTSRSSGTRMISVDELEENAVRENARSRAD